MTLFNKDSTLSGYKDGLAHAKKNKSKDYSGLITNPKSWIYGNPAMDSYVTGYDKGYNDGLANKHQIYSSMAKEPNKGDGPKAPNKGNNDGLVGKHQVFSSMPKGSYKGGNVSNFQTTHILADADSIESFSQLLSEFKTQLYEKTSDLKTYIDSMENNSWNDENYILFKEIFSAIRHKVDGIEGSIIDQSMLPKLQKYIEKIRKAQMKG